jgi:DNA-binding NtrC family response regulator
LAEKISERYPQSRVILMTAYGSEETEKRARDLGLAYLTKQMDLEHISDYLR